MTDKYEAPFEGGKTPNKNPGVVAGKNRPVGSSRAAHLARMALNKAASKPVKEEVELDEAFVNGREFASHGLMHPTHASQPIHQVSDRYVDFYASGTGDKMQGKVKVNDGKSVHIQAHPKTGDGKLHKFKVSTDLPKTNEEVELDEASTKPKSIWQQAAIDGRKKGTELGKKTAEEFHKNVNAKGIHRGHPEHEDLFYKHVDKFSKKTLTKNFTSKGAVAARHEHTANAAHDAFMRHIDKLHDTAMKKDPAYKAKFHKNEADNEKRSEQYRKDYELANDIVSRKVHPTRHGTPSPEAMRAAMINHHGDAEGNLPRHMGGRGTSAERARDHYNMWVAGTGGHGDRGYHYEEVEHVEEGLVGDLARAYFAPKAKAAASKLTTKVAKKFGATPQTQRRLAGAAAKWASNKLGEEKDDREYDYEGDMAMSQLKSIITNAQKLHDMLEPSTNLPEWVQSKITLAEDYVLTVANYMDSELDEEVEQIEEKKMGYSDLTSTIKSKLAKKKMAEAHDPVGREDADINNDGKTDKTDVYLHTKRRAIGKAISTRLAAKAGK